MSDRLPLM